MYKLMILVLALVAVAAAQYVPLAYNGYNGLYRGGYAASPYVAASPYAYSGLGYRTYGGAAYGAYPTAYLG